MKLIHEMANPEDTKLVPDSSDKYSASLLFLESQRLRTIANDTAIRLGHRGVMNLTPYQLGNHRFNRWLGLG